MSQISGDWQAALKDEFHQPYYARLYKTVMEEYRTKKIFPPPQDMFNAFEFTPLNDVKDRIPITMTDRPMACAFLCVRMWTFRRHW